MNMKQTSGLVYGLIAAALLAACGGGGSGSGTGGGTTVSSYTIGGSVSGLNGTVVLQNNGGDDITIAADGSFSFATKINNSSTYNVSVLTQPVGQVCTASSNAGTVSGADVSNVSVVCATNAYTVGGNVTGLSGTLVLQNNSGNDLTLTADGSFNFTAPVAYNGAYSVSVLTQPAGQTCSVSTGAGTMSAGNVGNVAVVCSTNAYTVGGTVSGLSGTLVLQNNGGDNLTLTANGNFNFTAPIAYNGAYNVSVLTQPTGQTCSVSTGAGTMSAGNVGNVAVVCSTNAYTVGGTVSGLSGTLVLQNNGGNDLTLTANGNFTFTTPVAYGSAFAVTVFGSPILQSCSIANGTGTMAAGNVSNVAITCATNTYTVGGTVSGLNGSMVLQNNGADNLNVAVNGSFNFVTALNGGSNYSVSVLTPPTGQHCRVGNGAGTLAANIGNVSVACFNNLLGGAIQGTQATPLNPAGAVAIYAGQVGVAGSLDNTGVLATFYMPSSITSDGANLYVADAGSNLIRKIDIASGAVVTLAGSGTPGNADGTGATASFNYPLGITTDGTNLYVTDTNNRTIRQVVIATGVVTTLAGQSGVQGNANGMGTAATFTYPWGITTDGTNLFVSDWNAHLIRKIVIASKDVTTLAGSVNGMSDGTGAGASFSQPAGLTTDGTNLYVADSNCGLIRQVVIASGVVTTIAGGSCARSEVDGVGAVADFKSPVGITTDGPNLYVTDSNGQTVRKVVIATRTVSTLAGVAATAGSTDGTGAAAKFNSPYGIATDGTSLYVADMLNNTIRKMQ